MMAYSDSLFRFKARPVAQSYVRSWLDQRHIPEHPGMRTSPCTLWYGASPTKLLIVNPIPQHDVKPNGELGGCRLRQRTRRPVVIAKAILQGIPVARSSRATSRYLNPASRPSLTLTGISRSRWRRRRALCDVCEATRSKIAGRMVRNAAEITYGRGSTQDQTASDFCAVDGVGCSVCGC